MSFHTILVETRDAVGLITFNRPQVLNAANSLMMKELGEALDRFERDPVIGAIVITGSQKAFSAGADIGEMKDKTFAEIYGEDFITGKWERIALCRKPVIAAVSGFALGIGCEMAMMCDIIIAADSAKFGQPEITIGIPPGAGATQRLTRAVGKAKAMDMCLSGRMMDAQEAERAGLVSRVVPAAQLIDETMTVARKIALQSRGAAMLVKECVNRAFETTLAEGVRFERRLFHAAFATPDQKEGMTAFLEKRKPAYGAAPGNGGKA